jgi:hypothetical protein
LIKKLVKRRSPQIVTACDGDTALVNASLSGYLPVHGGVAELPAAVAGLGGVGGVERAPGCGHTSVSLEKHFCFVTGTFSLV